MMVRPPLFQMGGGGDGGQPSKMLFRLGSKFRSRRRDDFSFCDDSDSQVSCRFPPLEL
ncbi:hypothetical protein E2C01_041322 [Portunus trituberculatus]|uniref:Uncharacterized protein n=1 Tax=Portunus trituberculatus TaxID=210409 RepID=A0A5B7FMA7_PORTR|nr:hypothetical protein [Portunus trituberculatus]